MKNKFKVKEMLGGIDNYIIDEQNNNIFYKSVSNIIKFDYITNKRELLIKTKSKILDFLIIDKNKKILAITNKKKKGILIYDIKNKIVKKNEICLINNEYEKKDRKLIYDNLNKIIILVKKMENEKYNFEIYKFFELEIEFLGSEKIDHSEKINKISFLKSEINIISLLISSEENFSVFEINLDLKKENIQKFTEKTEITNFSENKRNLKNYKMKMKLLKKIILKEKIKKIKVNEILEYIIIITISGKIGIFDIEGNFILNFSNSLKIRNIKKIVNFDFNNINLIILDSDHKIFFFNLNNFQYFKEINFCCNKLEKFENIFIHDKFDYVFLKNQKGFLQIFDLQNLSFINKLDILNSKIVSLFQKNDKFILFTKNFNLINLLYKNNKISTKIEKLKKIQNSLKFSIYDSKSNIILLITDNFEIYKLNSLDFQIIEKLEKKFDYIYNIKYLQNKKILILRDKERIYFLSVHPFLKVLYILNSNLLSVNKFLYKFFIFDNFEKNFKLIFFEKKTKISIVNLFIDSNNDLEQNNINSYNFDDEILNVEILKKKKLIIFLTKKPSLKLIRILTGKIQKEILLDFFPKNLFLGFNEIFIFLEKTNYFNKKDYIICLNLYDGKKYGGIPFFDNLSFLKCFENNLIFCGKNGLLTILDYPKNFTKIKKLFENKNFFENEKKDSKKKLEKNNTFTFQKNSEKKIGFLKQSFFLENLKLKKIENNSSFKNDLEELENIFNNDFSEKENIDTLSNKINKDIFEKNNYDDDFGSIRSFPILPDPEDIDDI